MDKALEAARARYVGSIRRLDTGRIVPRRILLGAGQGRTTCKGSGIVVDKRLLYAALVGFRASKDGWSGDDLFGWPPTPDPAKPPRIENECEEVIETLTAFLEAFPPPEEDS